MEFGGLCRSRFRPAAPMLRFGGAVRLLGQPEFREYKKSLCLNRHRDVSNVVPPFFCLDLPNTQAMNIDINRFCLLISAKIFKIGDFSLVRVYKVSTNSLLTKDWLNAFLSYL